MIYYHGNEVLIQGGSTMLSVMRSNYVDAGIDYVWWLACL